MGWVLSLSRSPHHPLTGGWWYRACTAAHLTGQHADIAWFDNRKIFYAYGGERGISWQSWSEAEMLLLPNWPSLPSLICPFWFWLVINVESWNCVIAFWMFVKESLLFQCPRSQRTQALKIGNALITFLWNPLLYNLWKCRIRYAPKNLLTCIRGPRGNYFGYADR